MNTKTLHSFNTALGVLTAVSATANAATVQITLLGNKISSTSVGGNSLNSDITGDGTDDLTFTNSTVEANHAGVFINGNRVYALWVEPLYSDPIYIVSASFRAGYGDFGERLDSPTVALQFNPISLTDPRINGGAITEAWLEVHAFNIDQTRHTVALTRVIFDDASTNRPYFEDIPGTLTEFSAVPEPSGLALLALGAGGLLARRRRVAI